MVEVSQEQSNATYDLVPFPPGALELLRQLQATGRPLALTIDGKVEAILQSPAEYEHLVEVAEHAQAEEDAAFREAEEDIRAGRTHPVDEVFDEIRRKYASRR